MDLLFLNYIFWICCFIFYPSWLVPDSFPLDRAVLFLLLLGYFTINYFFLKRQLVFYDTNKENKLFQFQSKYFFIFFSSVFFIIQFVPIFKYPVAAWNDEGVYASSGPLLLDKLEIITGFNFLVYARIIIWLFVFFLFVLFLLGKLKDIRFEGVIEKSSIEKWIMLFIILFSLLEFAVIKDIPSFSALHRFPPISKIIYTVSSLMFGYNIVPLRIIQFVFILASFYIFLKILDIFNITSLFKYLFGVLYLSAPWAMVFAHSAQLPGGVLFFQMIIAYYFIQYLIKKDAVFLYHTAMWIGIGFLYKRPIYLFAGIIVITLLVMKGLTKEKHINAKSILMFFWVSTIPAIPWLYLGKYLSFRGYTPIISNYLDSEKFFVYLRLLLEHFSHLIVVAFFIGSVWFIYKRRSMNFVFFLFWFFSYYLLFTGDSWIGMTGGRGMLYFFIPVLLLTIEFISNVTGKYNKLIIPFLLVLLCVDIFQCSKTIGLTYRKTDNPELSQYYINSEIYLPYDKALSYLHQLNINNKNILIIEDIGEATFYIRKYKIQKYNKIYRLPREYDFIKLEKYCFENNIDYLLLPYNLDIAKNPLLLNKIKFDKKYEFSNLFSKLQIFQFRNNFVDVVRVSL